MNYVTACPACDTQFLITKEHLKAYRGKVQCGHCNHVFNAKNRLTEVSDEIQHIEEYAVDNDNTFANDGAEYQTTEYSVADYDSTETDSQQDLEQHGLFDNDHSEEADNDVTTDSETEPLVPAISHAYIEPAHNSDGKPLNEKLNVVLEGVPDLSDLNSTETPLDFTSPPHLFSDENASSPYISNQTPIIVSENDIDIDAIRAPILIEDLTTDPKFQLSKPKRNIWLVIACLMLITIALLQSVYFLRSKIAAEYPQFKPYLLQACMYLNCKINLPQQLDLLTIDDSDMQESDDYQDVIHFSSLLINNAAHVQAYPNIELTLTDVDDKPVLRKLVKPQEYLQSGSNADSGLAAHQEERIKLAINIHDLPVAGYRVLLTY